MNIEPTPIARQLADGTPERLGRYRLVRPISSGGMARVFEARRESLAGVNPRVAIKVILPDFADNQPFQDLFVHEARIGSMLQHQNVVQIQDFDCADGLYYLVMEYVDGLTLRRVVSLCRRHGVPVPLDVIAEIGRQVCDGLAHAHAARADDGAPLNLVHRDIKPSNLMINPQGVIKLLDFGISKGWSRPEYKGAVRGTWGYMAPEQAEGESVNLAADLFGLAVVLFELAAVQPLFKEKEPDVLKQLLSQDEAARRAAKLPREYAGLARVLVRAMQRDPAARFESALAMGRALSALVQDPVSAREGLRRFQSQVSRLNDQTKVVRKTAGAKSVAAPEPDAVSVTGEIAEPGLPLSFGDIERPVRPVRRVEPSSEPELRIDWGRLALPVYIMVAIGILAYTSLRLFNEPSAPVAANGEATAEAGVEPSASSEKQRVDAPEPSAPTPDATRDAPKVERTVAVDLSEVEPAVASKKKVSVPSAVATVRDGDGLVTISSLPKAKVYLDGQLIRHTPLFKHEVKAGAREVRLVTSDGRSHSFKLDVRDGADIHKVWSFEDHRFVGN
jgi:serine/threonine-protein kinase